MPGVVLKRPWRTAPTPRQPAWSKAQNRAISPVRVSAYFLAASSSLRNDKITPPEYLLEDFMNNAG
jgi:hypothetical protein